MKKVMISFGMPKNTGYAGGIANIVNQYLNKSDVFGANGCEISHFDAVAKFKKSRLSIINKYKSMNAIRKKLDEALEKENADILHVNTSRRSLLTQDLIILNGIRKRSVKKVMTIHFAEINKILFNNSFYRKFAINSMNKSIDMTVFLSEQTRNEFIKAGLKKEKSTVLYTFHDYVPDEERVKESVQSHNDRLKLLFMGSIDKRKGIANFL